MTGEMTPELQAAVDNYNNNLADITQKILKLQISDTSQIETRHLWDLFKEMAVINNIKSRRATEDLLEKVIREYGVVLQDYADEKERKD